MTCCERHAPRRAVALAYREAMTEGLSHHASWERAWAVFVEAKPERAAADRSNATLEVNRMIASAI
jgi:hypothetical protein